MKPPPHPLGPPHSQTDWPLNWKQGGCPVFIAAGDADQSCGDARGSATTDAAGHEIRKLTWQDASGVTWIESEATHGS